MPDNDSDASRLASEEIEDLLYRQGPIARFTQDSPVLPDVWLRFAEQPALRQDVLITPYQKSGSTSQSTGLLAKELRERLDRDKKPAAQRFARRTGESSCISYNQTTVAARLYMDELIRVVLPMSSWWKSRVLDRGLSSLLALMGNQKQRKGLAESLARKPDSAAAPSADVEWMIRVIGTLVLLNDAQRKRSDKQRRDARREACQPVPELVPGAPKRELNRQMSRRVKYFDDRLAAMWRIVGDAALEDDLPWLVHLVSANRPAAVSIWRSRATIKADAARLLFKVDCSPLCWAIIDSGIDARHPAFRKRKRERDKATGEAIEKPRAIEGDFRASTRIIGTYDFTLIRSLLSADPADHAELPERIQERLSKEKTLQARLRRQLRQGRQVDWETLLPFLEIKHDLRDDRYQPPGNEHGTHVAGILAADWRMGEEDEDVSLEGPVQGVCPDINLLDLRVFDDKGHGDEFSVMAAMQYVRYLNSHKEFQVVHGVNLSMSIRHDVRNYACGRTPVCEECQRLIDSRLVVVVAAGNRGYEFDAGSRDGRYRSISITDPGNAEGVITVGATHRNSPHSYGVSFFSSRGPTGDGRMKPDLVAPGEKIESCIPGNKLKRLDGTSMAAPHVSGAAAQLMARHVELIGEPARIKAILCQTATDLGRERDFQGAGMLDALRALQSI